MENDTWNELIAFMNKVWPFNNNIELNQATRLSKDLEIGGDDAEEVIYEFSKKFNVNIENFTISRYFDGYPESTFLTNIMFKQKSLKEKELTLGNLEYAILTGKLEDCSIN